ncbi:DeoR family transcriptional regulator [Caulobacter sp. Root655]|uniref:DeoR/GlpR family DNA-binding transcription regulator n=1 Tax=Caulobacter sp. Root655 TaxID=1736578 RepID=UPI0006FCAEDA|nr:DeoR/GlpR family DNA-binding transcription regulator [Caulobacter sp. Root655]KRA61704.1 DeoR family transcriptional regulator [Caulobacter sp. Root655]
MTKRQVRQQAIIARIQTAGTYAVRELAHELRVSEETIRRELKVLEANGAISKVHGAASLPLDVVEGPFELRLRENAEAKQRIARAVADLVPDGGIVHIDSGTTSYYVAKALRQHRSLTVITNSVAVTTELGGRNDNKVFLSGGELDYQYKAFFDHRSCDYLAEFTPSLAVLSVGAISRDQGLMDFHSGEAAVNRIVYGKARTVILAADATKFDRYGLIRTAQLTDVDVLVTDLSLSPDYVDAFAHARIVIA